MTKKQLKNTVSQIYGIFNDKIFNMNDSDYQTIKSRLAKCDNDEVVLYVLFVNRNYTVDDPVLEIDTHIYDIAGIFLGIESLQLMKYQRLDRIVEFMNSSNEEKTSATKVIAVYREKLETIDWIEREQFLIFSGVILHLYGTTYTKDVDFLIVASTKSGECLGTVKDMFKDTNKDDFDYHILLKDCTWYKQDEVLNYQKQWLTYILPRLGGAKDIWDVLCNPEHYFFYMGMKCISLDITIQRLISRVSSSSIPDLIMLEKVNGIDINKKRICIPNMNIRHGAVIVYTDTVIENLYRAIIRNMKQWHDIDMQRNDIAKILKRCSEDTETIYYGDLQNDPTMEAIKKYHTLLKRQYIMKYGYNKDYLLDVGAGRLRDAPFWNDAHVKNVVAIEPSMESINKAYERMKKISRNYNTKVTIIHGKGDDDWSNNKYNALAGKKMDCIFFNFTIHYMIDKIDVVMTNIRSVSKKDTKVVIFCLNGQYIREQLNKNKGRYEVRDKQEPMYGIYRMDTDKKSGLEQILVYFRSTYGVSNGSIEFIVDLNQLKSHFKKYGYELVEESSLVDFYNKYQHKVQLTNNDKMISKVHSVLVFNYA